MTFIGSDWQSVKNQAQAFEIEHQVKLYFVKYRLENNRAVLRMKVGK